MTRRLVALAVVAGALDAWAGRFLLNPDGIAFLDIADLYAAGDWHAALSSVRGPLYAWLLALGVSVWRPSPPRELLLVHLVNFAVFLGALAAFAFFLRAALARLRNGESGGERAATALTVWGWAIFIRAALTTAPPRLVTPDLLVMAAMLLLAGLLLRLASGDARRRTYATLGVVLGLGYLAKEVMLPLGLVVLALALAVVGRTRRGRAGVALAAAVFFLTAAPFVLVLSTAKGRFTVGESARVNLVWSAHPQGADQPILAAFDDAALRHPPRRLLGAPAVWEFATPVPGTSPIVFDTAYWFEGARLELSPVKRLPWLLHNTGQLLALLRRWLPAFTLLGVLVLAGGRTGLRGGVRAFGVVAALGVAPFPLYLLTYVEGRYVAGAMVLLLVTAFAAVRLPQEMAPRRWRQALAAAAMVFVTLPPLAAVVADAAGELRAPRVANTPDLVAATALGRLGLRPGDGVAVAGGVFDVAWARLARVRVIVAIDDDQAAASRFEATPPAEVRAVLAGAGVRAVVSRHGPVPALGTDGWVTLEGSGFVALPLHAAPRRAAEIERGPRV